MAGKRAAHRYAKALLSLANESDILQQVDADMRLVNNTISASRDLQLLLRNPVVKDTLKLTVLKNIFSAVDKQTTQLFETLLQNKRLGLLPRITESFIALVDEKNGVVRAEVTTAVPLTDELEKKVLAKVKEITGNEASLMKKVDENLIGGFLLRVGDLQYDASISGRLNRLKQKFKQNELI